MLVTDVDGEGAIRTAAEIGAAEGLAQDVRDPASHTAVAAAATRHGVLAAWFNNAGVGDDGALHDLSEEAVRRLVEVNFLGALWGMRAAIAAFGPAGGDIVNTASLAGLGPTPGYSVYAATKAAVVSASMSVAGETPRRVRVHALCPDGVQTAMLDAQDPAGLGAALVHSGGRILTVEEIAAEAVALIGSRRVVRTVPAWRAATMRTAALTPSVSLQAMAIFAAQGRRAMRRSVR